MYFIKVDDYNRYSLDTNSIISLTPGITPMTSITNKTTASSRKSINTTSKSSLDSTVNTPIATEEYIQEPVSSSTNKSAASSGGIRSSNSRRVSFGSPILNPETPNNDYDNFPNDLSNNSIRTSVSKSRGSRSSIGARSSVSSRSSVGTDMDISLAAISTPGSAEFPRGRVSLDETYLEDNEVQNSDNESSEGEDTLDDSGFTTEDSLVASAKKRKALRPHDSEEEESNSGSDEGYSRRSKRQTKGKRFQFWKNERVVYDKVSIIGYSGIQ